MAEPKQEWKRNIDCGRHRPHVLFIFVMCEPTLRMD